jgi:hypothetical protein
VLDSVLDPSGVHDYVRDSVEGPSGVHDYVRDSVQDPSGVHDYVRDSVQHPSGVHDSNLTAFVPESSRDIFLYTVRRSGEEFDVNCAIV